MKVNNVQSNQNFGMALKITKGGKKFLQKQTIDSLDALTKADYQLKDHKYWDLVVTNNGYSIVTTKTNNVDPKTKLNGQLNLEFFNKLYKTLVASGKGKNPAKKVELNYSSKLDITQPNFNCLDETDKYIEAVKMLENNSKMLNVDKTMLIHNLTIDPNCKWF